MKKIFIIFILLFAVSNFFGQKSFAADPSALQQQIEKVRKEQEILLEEQRQLQIQLDAISKESQTLGTAVKSLDATKNKLIKDISVTQSKISAKNLSIQSLENTMSEKEQQIVVHRKAISQTLATLSKYDSYSLLLNLLASAQVSDIWKDSGQLNDLGGKLEEEISLLRETRKELNQKKEVTIKEKQEQLNLRVQLSGQKSVVEENQNAKAKLLAETKSKEAEYQKLLATNIARQKESENDLYRLETELAVAIDPSLYPKPKHGILSWPLDYVYVTQRFGKTVGGAQLYAQGFHNGIDFRASMGTPVKAVLSGTVAGSDNTDNQRGCYSYGRWILIRHANGLTSIYAHLSASLVKAGQTVTDGQIIGYSGGTPGVNGSGYSTGPHLHLGLFASQGVEISQFVTSKNCKEVFVPIAKGTDAYLDPLAYLPTI